MKLLTLNLITNTPSGKILEIGACVGDALTGEVIETFSQLVDSEEDVAQTITHFYGITDEEVLRSGVSLSDAYHELKILYNKHICYCNPVVWGNENMITLLQQVGDDEWGFGRRSLDVKTVFQTYRLANGNSIPGSLESSMAKMGLRPDDSATAEKVAINIFKLYYSLLEKFNEENENV